MTTDEPIAAVSSPPGRSLRGLLRATGPSLGPLVDLALDPPPAPRVLAPSRLRLHGPAVPCLALYQPGPASFTGQDTLEIQLPGNPALLERALHHVLGLLRELTGHGRIAEPGEFTQRAFMAGRIDLTQAEGIAATIGARSEAQLRAATLLRTGRLGAWAVGLVDRYAHILALVEAGIDFVDQDDVVPIAPGDLDRGLAEIQGELASMLSRSRSWSALEALPWVVLVGEPNVGKSTLFNTLLGRDRAVTSDIAGTTRDVLTEPLKLDLGEGVAGEVMLVDVAGLDESAGTLNRSMQQQAQAAIGRAELVVLLHDRMDEPRITLPDPTAPVLRVQTKADLGCGHPLAMHVSAVTGAGMEALRRAIAQRLRDRAVTLAGEMLALQPRHRQEIDAALHAVRHARAMLAPQLAAPSLTSMELIAQEMRDGLDHLGALGGAMTPDDVIGKVFSTFCIGK